MRDYARQEKERQKRMMVESNVDFREKVRKVMGKKMPDRKERR